MWNEFLDYFKMILEQYDLPLKEHYIDLINRSKDKEHDEQVLENICILHMNIFRKKNIHLVDYANYKRCKECNLPIPGIDYPI